MARVKNVTKRSAITCETFAYIVLDSDQGAGQAIEAKENVQIQAESVTLASVAPGTLCSVPRNNDM